MSFVGQHSECEAAKRYDLIEYPVVAMESSTKRRKLGHAEAGLKHKGLINFASRQTAQISTASTFILQTDELLSKTRLDYANTLQGVDGHLHALKSVIESIEPHSPIPVCSQSIHLLFILLTALQIPQATKEFEKKHGIRIPYPEPKPAADAPYKVSFSKPAQCNIVGSYVARTMIKGELSYDIDMIVQMPKDLFQEKDYQNLRYFYRRAYYLAYIAAHVQKTLGEDTQVSKALLHDNPLLPILQLRTDPKSNFSIRIIPCAPADLFPASKLVATANCNKNAADEGTKKPTPFYNSSLKAEGTYVTYLRLLTHTKKECPAFVDACILGRIWLRQRGFGSAISSGGFGHFEWAIMLALLLQTGGKNGQAVLASSLSASELFKAGVQFLATTDFNKKPFVLGATSMPMESLKESGPVLYDSARELNILAKMGSWSANLLRAQATAAVELSNDEAADKFEPTFILRADGKLQMFDAVFEVRLPGKVPERLKQNSSDCRGQLWDFAAETQKILKRAYGNRAKLIHVQLPAIGAVKLTKDFGRAKSFYVGIIFDPANMPRSMEYGPPAEEQKEAARFRQLWGEKAELRRFKDGSILECVDWSDGPTDTAAELCKRIGQYVMQLHLKVAADQVEFWGDGIANLLGLSVHDKASFDSVRQAFGTFERDIRELEDMPLQIRQLSPISSDSRYALVHPPQIGYHQGSLKPMDVNLYFEASSRWPENLTAIQEAKIEFLLDIDRRLTSAHSNITTHLGRENIEIGIENLVYLDVVYDTGAAFRLRILCNLEETLLQRQVVNKTLSPQIREEAADASHKLKWRFETLPLHTQIIATFCTRLSALSGTIRLVKHWFNRHKLSGHFSEELIELFVLRVFLQPYPWSVPSSESAGFLRTLLWLSKWDWRDEPLIVDSSEEMTNEQRSAVHQELRDSRKRDPNMMRTVMIVATSHDMSGLGYTRNGPTKLIASRMTRLAKAAHKEFHDKDLVFDPAGLFETSLKDYDVLLHLSPKALKGIALDAAADSGTKRASQFKNLIDSTSRVPVPVRTEPAQVLADELNRVYADTLIFFPGSASEGETVIGAIWSPQLQRQKFRVGLPYNFHKIENDEDESDLVDVNRTAVLAEIARIGGEMIRKIEELSDDV